MVSRIRTAMDERDQGFTLIELLVVIIIIGILAAIAIPVFLNQRKKGVDASLKSDIKNAAIAAETYAASDPTADLPMNLNVLQNLMADSPDFKLTPGNVMKAKGSTQTGYCISAYNAGATAEFSSATSSMKYTSSTGGFIASGAACTSSTG